MYVDQHGLAGVLFHQRDMLVCGGVEYYLRMPFAEYVVQAWDLAYVADHRNEIEFREASLQFQPYVVHRCLGIVEQEKLLHSETGQLAAKFAADGPGRSGHKDGLSFAFGPDLVNIEADLLASQQVLDLDCADLVLHYSPSDHFVDGRRERYLYSVLGAEAHERILLKFGVGLRGEEYAVESEAVEKGFELGLVDVKECEQSTVNTIIVENKSVAPLLLVDGEEIVGGDQNRIMDATILIAPESEMKVPVNCTEHGRWGYVSDFKQSKNIANYRTRLAKHHAFRSKGNVQKAVWDSIDELEVSRSFSSPTQAMSESYENAKSDLSEFMEVFEVVEGQTGVAVMIDGEVKGFEVFLNSEIYR